MIQERVPPTGRLLVVGAVRGPTSEVPPTLRALEEFRPEVVGLALSPEEHQGLRDYFVRAEAEPVIALTGNELAEVSGLARYGEVRLPNPTYVGVLTWAAKRSVPVEALDPSDERYANLFARHIGYFELVRRTVTERRLARRPPEAPSAEAFTLAWHAALGKGRGSRRLARARDSVLTEGARGLARDGRRVAVVVDRERYASVRELLGDPTRPDTGWSRAG